MGEERAFELDPVIVHSRREGLIIGVAWLACLLTCCATCYVVGYRREGRMLGVEDIHPIWGIPAWVVWGIFVPWGASAVFTFWFAGFYMANDDLGEDDGVLG